MRKSVCLLHHHVKTTQPIIMKLCTHTLGVSEVTQDTFYLKKKTYFFTKIEKYYKFESPIVCYTITQKLLDRSS